MFNTAVDTLAYTLGVMLFRPGAGWVHGGIALAAGSVAMIQSYFLQRRWVFRTRGRPVGFLLVTGAGLLSGAAATAVLAGWFSSPTAPGFVAAGIRAPMARLGGSLVAAMVNYAGYSLWAFRD